MNSTFEAVISAARDQGASDVHLEPGLPPALRIRGTLKVLSDPVPGQHLYNLAREILEEDAWQSFLDRRSVDFSRIIAGVRCRINILQTSRGTGFAIRLLSAFHTSIERLNLHPDLRKFAFHPHGLVIVSGSTGSGKSTTLAALIHEINQAEARHILTIESPIEYTFRPRRSFIRQREVGRDTPSFNQALLDALREDPDVLMVGEMRDPETIRLTLNASETGHLVLSSLHSSTCVDALQRMVSAFPPEIQHAVCAQLADCLLGVICQRLHYRPDIKLRIPECEVLIPNTAVRSHIRTREFHKIASALEIGAEQGMWTFARYRNWLEKRSQWHTPETSQEAAEPPDSESNPMPSISRPATPVTPAKSASTPPKPSAPASHPHGPIEIEPVEGGFDEILKQFDK